MNTTHLVGLMLVAGAFGAVAGGAAGVVSSQAPAGADPALLDRLSTVAKGVDALRDAAAENRDAVADVRERVVSVEMELERRARDPAPTTPSSDSTETTSGQARAGGQVALGNKAESLRAALAQHGAHLTVQQGDLAAATGAAKTALEQLSKSMKIRAMSEDERWSYATDTLGLNSVQVDELKAAQSAMQAAMNDAITESTSTTDGGATMTFRQVDGNKLAEAKSAFSERVDTVLNDEQKKAWSEGGFARAMSGGGRRRVHLSGDVRIGSDGTGSARSIELVDTDVIDIEIGGK